MPNKQNVETLATIKDELKDISAMWIVDYRGLSVKQIQELRRNIRESGAKMTVWKNTIMKLAIEELKLPDLGDVLTGPSALIASFIIVFFHTVIFAPESRTSRRNC